MAKSKDKKLYKYEMPLDGRLITGQDPAKIGPNYQTLVNMRYHKDTIRGVGGMTKVNTNALTTYTKVRSAHHFKKDVYPSQETHVLAEAWDSGLSAARIYQNTTAIGSDGNFSSTSLYTPTSSTPGGVFSDAPDGDCAYCNGTDTLIWGGTKRDVAGFINYDPGGDFLYDFTEEVRNSKTDSGNIAELTSTDAGLDSNVKVLLHFENNLTNSAPDTPQTFTGSGTLSYVSGAAPIGTYCLDFATDAKISASDNADFNLSGGTFTIDTWVRLDNLSSDYSIYYQNTTNDDDSFNFMIDSNGAVLCRIKAGGTAQFSGAVDFATDNGVISAETWYHIALVHSADDWYIFVNGSLSAYLSDSAEPANYTGDVVIGYDGTTYLEGRLDEFRISDSARWTSEFDIPSEAYGSSTTSVYMYIGSVRPADGFSIYIGTANTSASSMSVYYWDGSGWTSVSSLVDGTTLVSSSLGKSGDITFTSTDGSAKLKYIEGVYVYWYKVVVDAVDSGVTITNAMVKTPMQTVKDIWDGLPRPIDSFQIYKGAYTDATLNVRENEYDSGNTGTRAALDSLTAGTQWIICGFTEKMSGVSFYFVNGEENDTAGTVCSVDYWNGEDWATVGTIDDGTITNNVSFGKNGVITWNPPTSEYRQTINPTSSVKIKDIGTAYLHKGKKIRYLKYFRQPAASDVRLYYYRFSFSKNLAASVDVFHISGIPAQTKIGDYSFPMLASNRLWLLSEQSGRKNAAICSADGSSNVFNGEDSYFFEFGGNSEITGGAWLNSRIGTNIYNIMLFFKANETWALFGDSAEEWLETKRCVSSSIGCIAPHTIRVVDIVDQNGESKSVVVFQGQDGIYMTDGRPPVRISDDISDNFDPRGTILASSSANSTAVGMWDGYHKEYHWMFTVSGGSTHSKELVFDFKKPGWYEIARGGGTTNLLQYGIQCSDTSGVQYNYGFIDSGYMMQLEDGNDMNGSAIGQYFQTGDMVLLEGSITTECKVEYVCLVSTAKENTSEDIRFRYYMDGSSSRNQWTKSPLKSGYTIAFPVEHNDQKGAGVFHSFEVYIATDDETWGLEPQFMYILYSTQRDHTGDWR